jgi:MCP family monocarboxylic acid transporter-like MFS transporter 10
LAFGIMSAGTSLGGTIIPIAARNLIDVVGYVKASCVWSPQLTTLSRFKWTMRIVALIELFVLTVANLVRVLCEFLMAFVHGSPSDH